MRYACTARWAPTFLALSLLVLITGSDNGAQSGVTLSHARTASQEKPQVQALPAGLAPALGKALATENAAAYGILPAAQPGSDFHAANPAHHLTAAFLPDEIAITGDPADGAPSTWGMRLAAIGDSTHVLPVTAASPVLSGSRVEYRRGNVTEWYLNSPLGIEQGFTLAAPPTGTRTGNLVLALTVAGASVADDSTDGLLVATPGGAQMRYGQLKVTDATGRALPARLAADGSGVRIVVNDTGATYPVVVDPLVQQGSKLIGSGETGAGEFGFVVALSSDGNTALVGAYQDNSGVGATFVFTRNGGIWSQQGSKLTGSGETGTGQFGIAVALSDDGNTALIGAPFDSSNVLHRGTAFVFTRSNGVWSQQQTLTGSGESGTNNRFGIGVALSGDGNTALVGADGDSSSVGAAFVFTLSGGIWSQQQTLTGSGESGAGGFGTDMALSGDGNTALIGASSDASTVGAAFVFTRTGGVWTQQGSKLTGSGETGTGQFGIAVALSGDGTTALIGARSDNSAVGAAFVFTRTLAATASAGSPQSVPVGTAFPPLTVTITDPGLGSPVSNVVVTFIAPGSGASGTFPGGVTTVTAMTDASGSATAPTFTANATEGNFVVSVSVGNETIPVFSLANTASSATTIVTSTGGSQSATIGASFATILGATVLDAHNNPVPGISVTFAAPASGASGAFTGSAIVTTDSNGVATAPAFIANTTAGSYTVSATATGVSVPATFSLTNTPGPAASFAFSGFPTSVVAGASQPFTLSARDASGNIVTAYTGTVSFSSVNTAATLPGTYTFTSADQGVHSFSATLMTVGTGRAITATDTVTATITGTRSGIAVLPAVTNVSPFNGPQAGGTPVTITGIGLTGATGVTVGGSTCTSVLVNGAGTSLTCTTTGHPPGTVDVVVTTPNGVGTLNHGFTYLPMTLPPLPPPQPGGGNSPAPLPGGRPGGSGAGGSSPPVAVPTSR